MSEQFYSQFTAWETIKRAFTVIMDEYRFFGILLIVYVLLSVLPYLLMFGGVDFSDPEIMIEYLSGTHPGWLFMTLLYYVFNAGLYILVLDRTNASLSGYPFHDYPYFARAKQTIIPVIFLYISVFILIGIGIMLFIIPGLIAIAGLYLVIPAKLAENLSISDAIPRGWALSKGHRLGIWGVILIPVIPIFLFTFLSMGYLIGEFAGMETLEDINRIYSPAYLVLNGLFNGFVMIFYIVASGVAYHLIASETGNVDVP